MFVCINIFKKNFRANKKYLDERRSKAIPKDEDSDESIEEDHFLAIPKTRLKPEDLSDNQSLTINSPVVNNSTKNSNFNKSEGLDKLNSEPIIKENETVKNRQKVDSKAVNVIGNDNLSIDGKDCNCDSSGNIVDSKKTTDTTKTLESGSEYKEKRVTFLVENQDSYSEEGEQTEAFDEELPPLQPVQNEGLSLEKDLPKQQVSESEDILKDKEYSGNYFYLNR